MPHPCQLEDRLNRSLVTAANAMKEADAARQKGDWAAYGVAQEKLDKALKDALSAQDALGQDTSGVTQAPAGGADGAQSGAGAAAGSAGVQSGG